MSDVRQYCVCRRPSITAHASARDPSFAATPTGEASAPRAAKFLILVTSSLGLWWGIWLAVRSVALALLCSGSFSGCKTSHPRSGGRLAGSSTWPASP
jgi:hypothetical protein